MLSNKQAKILLLSSFSHQNCFDQLEVNQVVQVQMSPIYLLLLEEKTFKIVQAVCATE